MEMQDVGKEYRITGRDDSTFYGTLFSRQYNLENAKHTALDNTDILASIK